MAASCTVDDDPTHSSTSDTDAGTDSTTGSSNTMTASITDTDPTVDPDTTVGTSEGETEGATEGATEGDTEGDTEGLECRGHADCEGENSFCDPRGSCVACDVLDDGDTACADVDPNNPVCTADGCVQCTSENADACDGNTPVCGDANECVACTEHDECPDSACHLDGNDQGACFDPDSVHDVSDNAEIAAALAAIDGGQGVLRLAADTDYDATVNVTGAAEIAILGPTDAVLSGTGGLPSVNVAGTAIVYIAGASVANGDTSGVSCTGTSVWIDDSWVSDNGQYGVTINSNCNAYLRRTVVSGNADGGVNAQGQSLSVQTSAITGNGGTSTFGGIRVSDSEAFVTYTSIVGNSATNDAQASLYCTGTVSGTVRNSILVSTVAGSISGCGDLAIAYNGVDDADLDGVDDNVDVGAWDDGDGWFVNVAEGDLRLDTDGATAFEDIAQWMDGDPATDIDGNAIETVDPSFPGYHQPE